MKDDWKVTDLNDVVIKKKEITGKDPVDIYLPYDEPTEDVSWLMDLARAEEDIDKTGMINYDAASSPEKVLKDATISYLTYLRNYSTKLAGVFNSNKSLASSGIKVYGIANTEADFMVFRNSLKLIFSAQRPGVIQISFNAHTGAFFTSPTITPSGTAEQIGDVIHAQLGPFNEAIWTYQGRKVNTQEMVRYFLTRFIQNSSR
jgi:hypothetical protein